MSETIHTPSELHTCLLRNDRTIGHWELSFRGGGGRDTTALSTDLYARIESIVGNAPQNVHVHSIDLSLRGITGTMAPGIAEMLRPLPGLQRFRLQVQVSGRPSRRLDTPDKKLQDVAAGLVVGGLWRNDKSSLHFFNCEADCGPEAILALFARHSEL